MDRPFRVVSHTFSPKEKLMNIISMTLLTLLLLPLSGWSKDLNLFVIQRSKNTNEVQYQLHVNDDCQIVSDKPVGAFWHLDDVRLADRRTLGDRAVALVPHGTSGWQLLGTARYLAETKNFDGTVHFIFQPAEEGAAE